jgi:hypothetical protein
MKVTLASLFPDESMDCEDSDEEGYLKRVKDALAQRKT